MKVGIVGMPNAGKSSLFNALTKAGADAANYPFTTIEPNVAIVPVRDERLDAVARVVGASAIVPDTIAFHDIAGLVRGAHEGEGLGNQFLANIRETDAIVHVVRAHNDENVVHPEGLVDPLRDAETIETELIYADLEQAERRLQRVVRTARGGDKQAIATATGASGRGASAANPRAAQKDVAAWALGKLSEVGTGTAAGRSASAGRLRRKTAFSAVLSSWVAKMAAIARRQRERLPRSSALPASPTAYQQAACSPLIVSARSGPSSAGLDRRTRTKR